MILIQLALETSVNLGRLLECTSMLFKVNITCLAKAIIVLIVCILIFWPLFWILNYFFNTSCLFLKIFPLSIRHVAALWDWSGGADFGCWARSDMVLRILKIQIFQIRMEEIFIIEVSKKIFIVLFQGWIQIQSTFVSRHWGSCFIETFIWSLFLNSFLRNAMTPYRRKTILSACKESVLCNFVLIRIIQYSFIDPRFPQLLRINMSIFMMKVLACSIVTVTIPVWTRLMKIVIKLA